MIATPRSTLRPAAVAVSISLSTGLLIGCIPGSDDDRTESAPEVTSEPTDTGDTTTTATGDTATTTGGGDATDPSESPTTSEAPAEPEPDIYIASFDANGGSDLYRLVDDGAEPVTALALPAGPIQITDLALSSQGLLYGSTFDQLVRIDTASGDVEVVGPFGKGSVNALAFLPDGRLVAADLEGSVSIVDTETGAAQTVAVYPSGLVSSGDLAASVGGELLATATDNESEYLLSVDLDTGNVEILTASLPPAVYGLVATSDGELLGLTFESDDCDGGEVIVISIVDLDDVGYGSRGCLDFNPGGATGP